mmetsp:Transcript_59819/g.117335  ORF Transcript_59819/g.117335 Transcript_59819/m.117335 type:complete len:93 (-) Transcript_59819:346-624(-)
MLSVWHVYIAAQYSSPCSRRVALIIAAAIAERWTWCTDTSFGRLLPERLIDRSFQSRIDSNIGVILILVTWKKGYGTNRTNKRRMCFKTSPC